MSGGAAQTVQSGQSRKALDLPMPKVWAFAVGQFGWALLSGIISNWLVYFYQPDNETIAQGQTVFVPQGLAVLGVVTVVGGITAFARFFDAFVDPAVASLSDRCQSAAGRRMPFLKCAALPLALVTVLVFWSPINGTSWVNGVFLFVAVIGYYIALTFYCTPYNALIAELGHDSKQQLTISTAISFTWVAGTAIAYVAPVVWAGFVPGLGRVNAIRLTFSIMAAIALACMLVPPLAIKERDYVNSQPTSESTVESLKQTFGDGEFRKFVCSDVVYWVAITTFQTGLPFFVTSLLKLPETTTTIYFVLMTAVSVLFYLPVNLMANHVQKEDPARRIRDLHLCIRLRRRAWFRLARRDSAHGAGADSFDRRRDSDGRVRYSSAGDCGEYRRCELEDDRPGPPGHVLCGPHVRHENGPIRGDVAVHRCEHDRHGVWNRLSHRRHLRRRAVWHGRPRVRVLQRAQGAQRARILSVIDVWRRGGPVWV